MTTLFKKLASVMLLLSLFLIPSFFLTPLAPVQADHGEIHIGGCDPLDKACELGRVSVTDEGALGNVLGKVIQFIFVIAVILALGFLVYGGIKWLTSGGDKESVAGARNTIIAAIVGLLVIFLSYVILNLVYQFLTGQTLETVQIPRLGGQQDPPEPTLDPGTV